MTDLEIESLLKSKLNRKYYGRKIPRLNPEPTQVAYLCTPLTHVDKDIELARYGQALEALERLYKGYAVISPIVQYYNIAVANHIPTTAEFWWTRNKLFIERSDLLIAVLFKGFDKSQGCKQEVEYARSIGRKIWFVHPHELGIKEI